jgi:signal transduction histidine kinase
MRALIFELRPESLATEGIVAALTKQAASLKARHNVAVSTRFDPEPELPLATKEALYRIAQEALHNMVKHAQATAAELRLERHDETITLLVQDNGVGFDVAGKFPGHLGLISMRERIGRIGGTLMLSSALGHGTTVRASVPLHEIATVEHVT